MCHTTSAILANTFQNSDNRSTEKEVIITNLFDIRPDSDFVEETQNTEASTDPFFIKRPASKDYIESLLAYTEQNIADPNLTLKFISEKVLYMNTDYISKQFIQETGIRYTAYLSHLRIEKAKILIPILGKKKIHRVAEEVGFGNSPQYFSRIFKKNTGLTPSEYLWQTRKMLRQDPI